MSVLCSGGRKNSLTVVAVLPAVMLRLVALQVVLVSIGIFCAMISVLLGLNFIISVHSVLTPVIVFDAPPSTFTLKMTLVRACFMVKRTGP